MEIRPLTLLSPTEVWDLVDPLGDDLGLDPSRAGLAGLPYRKLDGPGFERLCYQLLVAEGHNPRFFGCNGQQQLGVDLVVEGSEARTVYQCKNLAEAPAWTAVRDAATKFETEWLAKAGLPAPHAFVYCCPQPLSQLDPTEAWRHFKEEFEARTGVMIAFWDKHALDTRLQRLPDLVAGLFSGSYAEHFCQHEDWLGSPWTRISWRTSGFRHIDRFLDYHRGGRVQVSAGDSERFLELLAGGSVLAVRGLPGAGKTMTALELACRFADPVRRIYYATLKDAPEPQSLWRSARRRLSLPSVFILDDCHQDLDLAGRVMERLDLRGSAPGGQAKLVLVLRDLPASGADDDTPLWLAELEQAGRVLDLKTDIQRTRTVAEHLRPELTGLSKHRLERLHHVTGGDLLLLAEQLESVAAPSDLDTLGPETLYASIRQRYFNTHRPLPTVARLASLAQFDLVPPVDLFDADWAPGERELIAPLVTELHGPRRYQFLHSTMAEVALRALVAPDVAPEGLESRLIAVSADALIAYLHVLAQPGRKTTDPLAELHLVLRTRLRLLGTEAEARIETRVLADEVIQATVEARLAGLSFDFLHRCRIALTRAGHPARARYAEFGLKYAYLAATNRTVFELLQVAQSLAPEQQAELMGRLDPKTAARLLDNTIAAGRSIGTLHLAMRELGQDGDTLLGRLEQSIGAEGFLRLIEANGTLSELFSILQYATPTFREALLDRLDAETAARLVDKTIADNCSIESFHFTLRMLAAYPASRDRLQERIGVAGWWKLILAVGTLGSLSNIARSMDATFRRRLIEAAAQLSAAHWAGIIGRGLFLNACSFAVQDLNALPMPARAAFRDALRGTAQVLAARATWFDLNPGSALVDPSTPEGAILAEALRGRTVGLDPRQLMGWTSARG